MSITQQPQATSSNSDDQNKSPSWMDTPSINFACQPNLEYLNQVDRLLIYQSSDLLESVLDFRTSNKYSIKNGQNQLMYYAVEETNFCTKLCLGTLRSFDLKILDQNLQEVMHIYRPLRCAFYCCPCCLQEAEVMSPPGITIGYVRQEPSLLISKYSIQNATENTILRLEGPTVVDGCNGCVASLEFPISSNEGSKIGKISKQWKCSPLMSFTRNDRFEVTFPMDLDVNIKALVLGASFLIGYLYSAKSNDDQTVDI
ncbi:Phospholipid scramblase 2-like protein [Dinothrombium tinctorium]|uniref:Phospholipid scramblase n=1 Tax=Dinothrombium tinctorium TaxID=1965070 RepID=A0A3S3NWF7_9ACAR|nr:Phospholipid scramblase 2-like protein [Dinothrombium tinctorium]RWS07397.1 Phospholipid scramblase 2-like protein [Dinothrombium tinctorium]